MERPMNPKTQYDIPPFTLAGGGKNGDDDLESSSKAIIKWILQISVVSHQPSA
jgi:hypothetical protein